MRQTAVGSHESRLIPIAHVPVNSRVWVGKPTKEKEAAGAAINLPQSGLTVDSLSSAVAGLLADPDSMARLKAGAAARARPGAAETIARRILALIK